MKDYQALVTSNREIAEGIYELVFVLPEPVAVRAGQFAEISVGGAHLLRRPFAICKAEGEKITVCFQVRGEGTRRLASVGAGERLQVLMPLGNGFFVRPEEKKSRWWRAESEFSDDFRREGICGGKELHAYLGFRNAAAVCGLDEFAGAKAVRAVTDDGSFGEKKNAVQALETDLQTGIRPDVVLACGPLPMLRALKSTLEKAGIPGYVSLEERMGCGIGACLVCVCNLTNGEHARVCKDGPVFPIGNVEL